jgi:hypothetical protein
MLPLTHLRTALPIFVYVVAHSKPQFRDRKMSLLIPVTRSAQLLLYL